MMQNTNDKPVALDTYENMAGHYATVIADNAANAHYERPGILSLLPDLVEKRILDAGCGPGFHAEWMAERGAWVTAIDISAQMVQLCQRRLGNRGEAYTADLAQPLSFLDDASFDIVLSSLTLHYIYDLNVPFAEFNRVLRPHGLLIFSMHHPLVEYYLFQRPDYFTTDLIEDVWRIGGVDMEVKFYSRPLSIISMALAQAGFCIDRIAEPLPTKACQDKYPETYQKLSTRPWFLFVRAEKK